MQDSNNLQNNSGEIAIPADAPALAPAAMSAEEFEANIKQKREEEEQREREAVVHPDPTFPRDTWGGASAMSEQHVVSNYGKRTIDLQKWLGDAKAHEAVTRLLEQYNHPDPTAWQYFMEPDVFKEDMTEAVRVPLVRAALHAKFLTVLTEDITMCLMAINSQDIGPYWIAYFERHVLPVMVRLKV